jgi:multidrug efflux system membrane fusion protein
MDEQVETPVRADPSNRTTATPPRSRLRPGRLILLALLLAAAGGGWYWWTHRAPKSGADQTAIQGGAGRSGQAQPQPVGVATVEKGDIRVILNELGTVTSLANVTVKTQLNGPLTEVAFQEGQLVQKGDFLAQIDPRPYQVTLEQAQGQLAHDQGLLQQAQTNLKRFQTLGKQDSIAQQQVDDQRYLVAQDVGTVQVDQAAIDSAKLNLAYAHIIAPVAGRVGLRQVDAGNYVTTTDTNGIVILAQLQPISVIFAVPEDNLPDIVTALKADGKLQVQAYDRANTKLLATGTLTTLDNQIDTTTGTLKMRAIFDNADEMLVPNQFVNIRLLVSTMKDTIRVPVPAVQRGEPGTFVYLVEPNNTVSVRKIKVGPIDGTYQAVVSGLAVGDRVVTEGTDRLRDGAAVVVPAATGTGTAPGGQGRGAGRRGGGGQAAGASTGASASGAAGSNPGGSAGNAEAGAAAGPADANAGAATTAPGAATTAPGGSAAPVGSAAPSADSASPAGAPAKAP